MSIFRFLLITVAILLAAAGIYSLFPHSKPPAAFTRQLDMQVNPFTVPADSVSIVRKRIRQFFDEPRRLLGGGNLEFLDSSWHKPYYNSHKKGDRILIEMHQKGDRFQFECNWWDSRVEDEEGGREIALFLQKGISRFD
jgi:hypothetical protein